ncbi:MAG TPA: AMP-binding protein [Quisquiliibacterium sp.]|nr:AMP-binding protein [Quisquiliibacterium sp.]
MTETAALRPRPWLQSYPEGLPAEIDADAYPSLGALFDEAFRAHAGKEFAVCMDRSMRFSELEALSSAFGAWLQLQGFAPGTRVAIMLPNVLQFPVALLGTLRAGCVAVPVNPLYTPRELAHQLKDSGAEVLVVLENFGQVAQHALPGTQVRAVVLASMGDLLGFAKGAIVNHVVRRVRKLVPPFSLPGAVRFNAALAQGRRSALRPAPRSGQDIAVLQYTGGTTGVSKGAVLTHRNVVAAMMQVDAAIDVAVKMRRPQGGTINIVTALPLYHIYGLAGLCLPAIRLGNCLLLIPNPRDIPGFVAELRKRPFHAFPGLNTLFNGLMANEAFRKLDFSQLVFTQAGGMATQTAVADRWQQLTGCVVQEGWGLSETAAIGTNNPATVVSHTGSIGIPLPSIDLRVFDDEGREQPPGEPGELCIRGPNVMAGYYNRPEETARAMTPEGYFRTGDIGTMDERGWFRIVDRKKDMILVSGFNVFPSEIEAVVSSHPGVLECAAIGVPDDSSGEAVKLFVVRREPTLTEQDIRTLCRAELTGYKQPRHIEFRDDLPKSPVGKVLRRELRE